MTDRQGQFWCREHLTWCCVGCGAPGHDDFACPKAAEDPPRWLAAPLDQARSWDPPLPRDQWMAACLARIENQKKARSRRKKLARYAGQAGKVKLPRDRALAAMVLELWDSEARGHRWTFPD